ncbi:MAG: hypothetical protein CML31_15240 [Rhizobiales bacterium]|nr:hypothetical protein [Hyphomicrobiales bacterium]|tara:strand:- start:9343 stop:9576 length:234 start_codon:yes stop_codon:yes gene_type:complete
MLTLVFSLQKTLREKIGFEKFYFWRFSIEIIDTRDQIRSSIFSWILNDLRSLCADAKTNPHEFFAGLLIICERIQIN